MKFLRKNKKFVSAVFWLSLYTYAWYGFHFNGFPNLAFAFIFLMNVINHSASNLNNEFYKSAQKTVVELSDKMLIMELKQNERIKKDREYITGLQNKFDEVVDVNNRLNAANYSLRVQNQSLQYKGE